jgi:RNA polymerase sigma-70 factor (ECF subfamily)
MLTSLKNFMATEHARERTLKRGGGCRTVSLDFDDGDRHFTRVSVDRMSPDRIFERSWTLSVLDRVIQDLRSEFFEADEADRFESLLPVLTSVDHNYAEIATTLGISSEAVRKAASRLRIRYREMLRAEVGRTLVDADDVDDEIRHMFESLQPA